MAKKQPNHFRVTMRRTVRHYEYATVTVIAADKSDAEAWARTVAIDVTESDWSERGQRTEVDLQSFIITSITE